MKAKKLTALLLTTAMVLSSGVIVHAEEEHYKLGVSWYSQSAQFMATCRYYMDKYVEENYGDIIELVHLDGDSDAANQLSQVETLINMGVDMVLLNPFDKNQLAPATEACVEAGIPCIEFNVETVATESRETYVGSDHEYSGELVAEAIAEALDGKGNVAVLQGPLGHDAQLARTKGQETVFSNYPDIKVVAEKECNWDRSEGMIATENMLNSGMEIDAILGQNDEMALGALEAIKGTEYEGKIIVVGIDGITDGIDAVRNGDLLCTALQSPKGQAEQTIECALMYMRGETLEDYYDVPFILITPENCDDPQFDTSEALNG